MNERISELHEIASQIYSEYPSLSSTLHVTADALQYELDKLALDRMGPVSRNNGRKHAAPKASVTRKAVARGRTQKTKTCPYCGKVMDPRGLGKHIKTCKQNVPDVEHFSTQAT